jgi:uncharacterized heparinase superfamily protein
MPPREIAWRTAEAARTTLERSHTLVRQPRWNRRAIRRVVRPVGLLADVHRAAGRGRWRDAHAALAEHIDAAPQRFVIAPSIRQEVVQRIQSGCPGATDDARRRADRIAAGIYDLLGYRGLSFDRNGSIDWHFDPVHRQTAPKVFWANVPFLDSACGDHKIIWELNRHQHWLLLGRACWLTGDSRYRRRFVDELTGWLEANPPLVGVNWASMLELAFRSLSWIWALNFFAARPDEVTDDTPWLVDLVVALDRQLFHVSSHLSRYFSPNTHLLGEALALYVAGRALPWLTRSERYEQIGRSALVAEIDRQILTDGGHCERSPHYHRYTLDFYCFALALARITGDTQALAPFERAAAQLGRAARLLADERGHLPHIGDDDGGMTWPLTGRRVDDIADSLAIAAELTHQPQLRIGQPPEEAFWLLASADLKVSADLSVSADLKVRPTERGSIASGALPETGYYVSRSAAGDHVVIDAGPHGFRNGGHSHADALSVTVTARTRPVVIDPGTACYTVDTALRDRFRSTALHNTLVIDEQPQSLPGGPFQWLRTADGRAHRWRTNAGFDYFEGSHDGYRPLEHRRHLLSLHGDLLVVADLVASDHADRTSHRADLYWHIDPQWQLSASGRRVVLATRGDEVQLVAPHGNLEIFNGDDTGLGWHSPIYGRLEPAPVVRLTWNGTSPFWMITVFGLNPSNPVEAVDIVPVWAEAGALEHSVALRILRDRSTDVVGIADPVQPGAAWRVGEMDTDARMLCCRIDVDGRVTRAALVDGSRLRASGRARLSVMLPARAADVHVDVSERAVRLSGDAVGATVQAGGLDLPVAPERRGAARLRTAGRSF